MTTPTKFTRITADVQLTFPCWLWQDAWKEWVKFKAIPTSVIGSGWDGSDYTHFAPDAPTPPREGPQDDAAEILGDADPRSAPALPDEVKTAITKVLLHDDNDPRFVSLGDMADQIFTALAPLWPNTVAPSPTVQQAAQAATEEALKSGWVQNLYPTNKTSERGIAAIITRHIAHLTASSAEDTARLDWLDSAQQFNVFRSTFRDGVKMAANTEVNIRFLTPTPEGTPVSSDSVQLRAAIDAARASTSKGAV